ncbi:autophagy protein 10 (ATG10) [Leishmania panamensis]|uniref:Autophagy protein 10 (ATG10) n=1 Tax=Leishmania panamensis TaxID=5679 RepID=A0A088RY55_LEIPA|nr:autophagy protein 10 (ATG10) [Leishmania panamensis]AIO00881.1 autophagy protein 10 (ATG10) [Leishmania panamensis]
MKIDAAAVHCTRESFSQYAHQRCANSPWELRSKRDAFGASVEWLEATYNVDSSLDATTRTVVTTVCVLFNAEYAVPQLGFYNSTVTSLADLRVAVPNLTLVNMPSSVSLADAMGASRQPLASFSWCQELGQYMWLVHPCDTENVLRCRRYDGEQGDVLSIFLRAMSDYFPFAPLLVPRAGGNGDAART